VIYVTQIFSLFGRLISLRTSLPHEIFSACSVHHTPLINAFSIALIPNEGSSKLRFGEVDKRRVLDIFKLLPLNNSLFQSVALTLEHNEIPFRIIRVQEPHYVCGIRPVNWGRQVDRYTHFFKFENGYLFSI